MESLAGIYTFSISQTLYVSGVFGTSDDSPMPDPECCETIHEVCWGDSALFDYLYQSSPVIMPWLSRCEAVIAISQESTYSLLCLFCAVCTRT